MTELERFELAKSKGYTYDPITGEIKGMKGNLIIRKNKQGYIDCSIFYNGRGYKMLGHRLAWYLHYGELPKNNIDHIDSNTSNNKIYNLRDVTQQQNNWNRNNTKGYYWHKKAKKYHARIMMNLKIISLGLFDDELDARNAYLEAKAKYHVIQ